MDSNLSRDLFSEELLKVNGDKKLIELKLGSNLLKYKVVLFAEAPEWTECVRLIQYNYCPSNEVISGFKRDRIYTKIIDLTKTELDISSSFRKNTRYEIHKAEKEGVVFAIEKSLENYVTFYNSFAKSKKIQPITFEYFNNYTKYMTITKAIYDNVDMVMHLYLVDSNAGRVRLWKSASLFRKKEIFEKRYLVGMANRFLHYMDMLYFQRQNYHIYDLGGYACEDKKLDYLRVNQFKDSFGGELIEESNYTSYGMVLFSYIAKLRNRVLTTAR